jgi:hypothetical protein
LHRIFPKFFPVFFFFISLPGLGVNSAEHVEHPATIHAEDSSETTTNHEHLSQQVNGPKDWFSKGQFRGLIRYHFMSTQNKGELSDFWANAIGGRLYYHTAVWHGFQVGVGGLFTFNIGSSDLTHKDEATGRGSRWERQLFDMTDPSNKTDLDRLEELFVKYHWRNSSVQYGKITINTPLVNAQDGRMKPSVFNGLWLEFKEMKNVNVHFGYFNRASPRSTVEWFPIEEAMTVYGLGVNPDGSPSGYRHNTTSKGLFINGLKFSPNESIHIQNWNYAIQNVVNTNFTQ